MKFNLNFFCFCCCCFSVYVMLIVKFINVVAIVVAIAQLSGTLCVSQDKMNKNGHYCQAATALIVDTKIKSNQSTQPYQSSIQLVCSASSLYIIGTF